MTTRKLNVALIVALCMGCWGIGLANAADDSLTPVTRGTNKVQPRFFDPFNVGFGRLTLNPFGIFSVSEPLAVAQTNPFSTGGAAATSSSTQAVTTTPPATTTLTLSPLLARPPFVPPDRSPFRPPPRPPFPP